MKRTCIDLVAIFVPVLIVISCLEMSQLDRRLENLTNGADEDEVAGVLAAILDDGDVPEPLRAFGVPEKLKAIGFCSKTALRVLELEDLVGPEVGMSRGHSKVALSKVHGVSLMANQALGSRAQVTLKVKSLPPLMPTGYPASREYRAWVPGYISQLRRLLSPEELAVTQECATRPELPVRAGYEGPSAAAAAVWDGLVNSGPDGIPARLLLNLDQHKVSEAAGFDLLHELSVAILSSSMASIGVLQTWFSSPDVVTRPQNLAMGLAMWERTVEQLSDFQNPQSDVAKTLSLLALTSKVIQQDVEFAGETAALKTTHKKAPGGVPVDDLVSLVREYAGKYTSVQSQKSNVAMYTMEIEEANAAESGAPAEAVRKPRRQQPRSDVPCKWHRMGKCTWGSRCRMRHEGPPGAAAEEGTQKEETADTGDVADLARTLQEVIRGVSQYSGMAQAVVLEAFVCLLQTVSDPPRSEKGLSAAVTGEPIVLSAPEV